MSESALVVNQTIMEYTSEYQLNYQSDLTLNKSVVSSLDSIYNGEEKYLDMLKEKINKLSTLLKPKQKITKLDQQILDEKDPQVRKILQNTRLMIQVAKKGLKENKNLTKEQKEKLKDIIRMYDK